MKLFKKIFAVMACVVCGFCFTLCTVSNTTSIYSVDRVALASAENPVEPSIEGENEHTQETEGTAPSTGEEGAQEENPDVTFEDFMSWAQEQANNYGYGDEFSAAVSAIYSAATQEQVTLSTIASLALSAFILVYFIVQKVKDKQWKKKLSDMAEHLNALVDGTNGLIDETSKAEGEVEKTERKAEEIRSDVVALQRGVTALVKAFMHFTDGTKLQGTKKEEVQSDCLDALKSLDGVASNEDNKE